MKRGMTLASASFAAALALFVAGCGSSSPAAPTVPPGGGGGGGAANAITIVGINGSNSFAPNPASVPVGQTVAWKNSDSSTHHIVADNGSFDAGTIAPGGSSAAVTVGNGAIPYHCTIHPSMVGTINGSQGSGPSGPGY